MICRNHVDVSEGVRRCSRCGTGFCSDCLVEIQGMPYCATCKTEQLLDFRSGVDRTTLSFAGIGRRLGAVIIDGFVVAIPFWIIIGIIAVATNWNPMGGNPWFNILSIPGMAISIAYEALMLSRGGQTLGKKALKVKVVRADGQELSTGQAWGRAVSRSLLGLLYIIDYIPAFFTKERTTLHDLMAGTRVVDWA